MLAAPQARRANAILGSPDDLKFRSSMTLFAALSPPDSCFAAALDRFFDGAARPGDAAPPRRPLKRVRPARRAAPAYRREAPAAPAMLPGVRSAAHAPLAAAPRHSKGSSMGILDILQQYTDPARAPARSRRRALRPGRAAEQPARSRQRRRRGVPLRRDAAVRADDRRPVRPLRSRSSAPASSTRSSSSVGAGGLASIAGGVLGRVLGGAGAQRARRRSRPSRRRRSRRRRGRDRRARREEGSARSWIAPASSTPSTRTLVKGLGAAALAIALGRMHSGQR